MRIRPTLFFLFQEIGTNIDIIILIDYSPEIGIHAKSYCSEVLYQARIYRGRIASTVNEHDTADKRLKIAS